MHWLAQHAGLVATVAGCLLAVSALALAPVPVLRAPIVFTRGHLLAIALLIGCLGAGGIGLLTDNEHASIQRRNDLRAQLERERRHDQAETLSRREVRAIARRTARLERPSSAELLAAIRRAADVCRAHPAACARAAQGFRAVAPPPGGPAGVTGTAPSPPGPGAPTRGPRPAPRQPTRPAAPSSPTSTSPTPPSRPRPPVQINPPPELGPIGPLPPVQLPPLPPTCTPVIDIGCPTSGRARLPVLTPRPPR